MEPVLVAKNLSKKSLSFDKNFRGDFDLKNNLLLKNNNKNFIYLGCQILNKRLFNNYSSRYRPVDKKGF